MKIAQTAHFDLTNLSHGKHRVMINLLGVIYISSTGATFKANGIRYERRSYGFDEDALVWLYNLVFSSNTGWILQPGE